MTQIENSPKSSTQDKNDRLPQQAVLLLAVASAIVTANAYYVHPIIGSVANSFGVSDALVGAVPALNQIALAFGVVFLLPLGDRISNRTLATACVAAQLVGLLIMAVAQNFWLFVFGSTILGFFTVTPYLLPAYTSKRIAPERLGHVTAILTTGIIIGILLARTGAGVVGEFFGWRTVYWIAAALMLAATIGLPYIMEPREKGSTPAPQSYGKLIASLVPLARQYPQTLISGAIQGLSFAIFLAVWMGVGLHLTSPEIGMGTDMVGYLAAITAINALTTPRLGRWADSIGPQKARLAVASTQILGVLMLYPAGGSFWLLLIPISLISVSGPIIDITGRMLSLNQEPAIRTRLMTLYIMIMFLGGGLGSWTGTIAYDLGGWMGTCLLCFGFSLCVTALAWQQARQT